MDDMDVRMRLDKWISSQGGLSRKQVKELARAGKIIVNGLAVRDAGLKVKGSDEVFADGKRLEMRLHIYIMMNKPSGVLSASRDNRAKTVVDLVPEGLRRPGLFPAGRLDKDTEGFVLITDDGALAHKMLSPASHVPKTYFARLDSAVDAGLLAEEFGRGVDLGNGDKSSPAVLKVLRASFPAEAELSIYEGMYHQVKRMFAKFGANVIYLKRISIGGLLLDPKLAPGECRAILHNELELIC